MWKQFYQQWNACESDDQRRWVIIGIFCNCGPERAAFVTAAIGGVLATRKDESYAKFLQLLSAYRAFEPEAEAVFASDLPDGKLPSSNDHEGH